MMVLRHVIELIVNPFFISVCLLGICTVFVWCRAQEKSVKFGLLTVFVILILISTGMVPQYLSTKLESQYPALTQVDPNIKWIVVLSGGQKEGDNIPVNQELNSASVVRMVEGLRLVRLLPKAKLLISGGASYGEGPEAVKMAQLAKWFAIPNDRIVLEKDSLNTADQAKNIKNIVQEQPFYLVTSALHMPRAIGLCKALGLNPLPAPTDFIGYGPELRSMIPNTYNMAFFTITYHELLGRIWAQLNKEL